MASFVFNRLSVPDKFKMTKAMALAANNVYNEETITSKPERYARASEAMQNPIGFASKFCDVLVFTDSKVFAKYDAEEDTFTIHYNASGNASGTDPEITPTQAAVCWRDMWDGLSGVNPAL